MSLLLSNSEKDSQKATLIDALCRKVSVPPKPERASERASFQSLYQFYLRGNGELVTG